MVAAEWAVGETLGFPLESRIFSFFFQPVLASNLLKVRLYYYSIDWVSIIISTFLKTRNSNMTNYSFWNKLNWSPPSIKSIISNSFRQILLFHVVNTFFLKSNFKVLWLNGSLNTLLPRYEMHPTLEAESTPFTSEIAEFDENLKGIAEFWCIIGKRKLDLFGPE